MIPQSLSRDLQLANILRRLNDLESSADLTGATITGGVIRTYGSGSARLEMDSDANNLIAYGDDGTEQARFGKLDDGTYGVTGRFVGADIDGADITGSTVTGGVVQTAEEDSGSRIAISAAEAGSSYGAQIAFYDSDNAEGQITFWDDDGSGWGPAFRIDPGWLDTTHARSVLRYWANGNYRIGPTGGSGVVLGGTPGNVSITNGYSGAVTVDEDDGVLLTLPTVSGKTANVYMDPSTGKLSRIA